MENNGRATSSKQTKHTEASYFFNKGHIDQGGVGVEYCSTEEIWEVLLNKPKKGKYFRYFRGELMSMGIKYDDYIDNSNMSDQTVVVELEG